MCLSHVTSFLDAKLFMIDDDQFAYAYSEAVIMLFVLLYCVHVIQLHCWLVHYTLSHCPLSSISATRLVINTSDNVGFDICL